MSDSLASDATAGGADFAEVFAEDVQRGSVVLDDGRIESLASGRDRGAGIRVVAGGSTGFAHTADVSERGLVAAARAAANLRPTAARTKRQTAVYGLQPQLKCHLRRVRSVR